MSCLLATLEFGSKAGTFAPLDPEFWKGWGMWIFGWDLWIYGSTFFLSHTAVWFPQYRLLKTLLFIRCRLLASVWRTHVAVAAWPCMSSVIPVIFVWFLYQCHILFILYGCSITPCHPVHHELRSGLAPHLLRGFSTTLPCDRELRSGASSHSSFSLELFSQGSSWFLYEFYFIFSISMKNVSGVLMWIALKLLIDW